MKVTPEMLKKTKEGEIRCEVSQGGRSHDRDLISKAVGFGAIVLTRDSRLLTPALSTPDFEPLPLPCKLRHRALQ
jgi:hypothetical protein